MELYCDTSKNHEFVTWLCGNHELAMAAFSGLLEKPDYVDFEKRWTNHYDSHTTFESYGVPHRDVDASERRVPDEHRRLLADLPWSIEHRDYLFVHAGLDRNMPF